MTMLRTNLATRPFYNERLVHWLIGVAGVLVVAFTAFNVSEYLRLSGRQGVNTRQINPVKLQPAVKSRLLSPPSRKVTPANRTPAEDGIDFG